MTRISTREYAAIAPSISEEGVRVNGAVIALDPDNSAAVAGAVKALLEQAPASEAPPRTLPSMPPCNASGRRRKPCAPSMTARYPPGEGRGG